MIKKDAFQNIKGRRVYQFYLDEETGEITDITSRDDYVQVIRCKDCKYYEDRNCTFYRDIVFRKYDDDFCSDAERKKNERT